MSNSFNSIEDIVKKNPIILFDGVCNLCNSSVQFVIEKDVKNLFLFAQLQDTRITSFLNNKNRSFNNIDSIILVTSKKIYTKSSAALTIAKNLKSWSSLLYAFYIIPKPIRDIVYDYIAQNRYKWYGKKNHCMIPTPELKNKFI